MGFRSSILLILLTTSGCATGGPRSAEPVVWTPGAYRLEGTVTHDTMNGILRETHRARLTITPQGFLQFEAEDGLCEDPTPIQAERDLRMGQRTFRCGDLTFRLGPTESAVWGEVTATAEVQRTVEQCIGSGPDRDCYDSTVTATSRETARMIVTRDNRSADRP